MGSTVKFLPKVSEAPRGIAFEAEKLIGIGNDSRCFASLRRLLQDITQRP
jgi:hypothetical protein